MVILLDGVVRQVDVSVVDVLQTVELGAESDVALFVEPDFGRVEVLNEHPLSDVEFPIMDDQRIFDVLLSHVLNVLAETVVHNVE